MKKLFIMPIALLVVVLSVFATACNNKTKTLETPVLTLNNKLVYWNAIDEADCYVVTINGIEYPNIDETSFDLTFLQTDGNYEVTVRAHSERRKVNDSAASNMVVYIVRGVSTETYTLAMPENLYVSNNVLYFDAVPNADTYAIYIDGLLYRNTSSTNCDLPTLSDGDHYAEVMAGCNSLTNYKSSSKARITFRVSAGVVSKEQLKAPAGLQSDGDIVKWDRVTGASGYIMRIDGAESSLIVDTYRRLSLTNAQRYMIEIKAVGNERYADSDYSDPIYLPVRLQRVSDISLSANIVTWRAVDHATSYSLELDGVTVAVVNVCQYILADDISDGEHSLRIKCQAEGVYNIESPYSAEVRFVTENGVVPVKILDAPQNLALSVGRLSWDNVSDALGYEVQINDSVSIVATNYVSVDTSGYLLLRVRALGDGETYARYGLFSAQLEYDYVGKKLVEPPYDLRLVDGVLYWSDDSESDGYTVAINDNTYISFDQRLDISSLGDGEYYVSVKSETMGTGTSSNYSEQYYFKVPENNDQYVYVEPELADGILSWQPIASDCAYVIRCNDRIIASVDETSFDLSESAYFVYTDDYMLTVVVIMPDGSINPRSYEVCYSYEGIERDPEEYLISNAEDLAKLTEYTETRFVLISDIDLSGAEWQPIDRFDCELDGNGHKIYNFVLSAEYHDCAFVIENNGYIHDLTLESVSLDFETASYGTTEYATVLCVSNKGWIHNVSLKGITISAVVGRVGVSAYAGVNYGYITGGELSAEVTVSGKGEEIVYTVAGGVLENYGYCELNTQVDVKVYIQDFSEANVAGIISSNSGAAKLHIADGGVNINVTAGERSFAQIGGVIYSARRMSDMAVEGDTFYGHTVDTSLLSRGVSIDGSDIKIELHSYANLNYIGGVICDNALDLNNISLKNITIISDTSDGGRIGGVAYNNRGTLSGILIDSVKIEVVDMELSNNATVTAATYVYENSGTLNGNNVSQSRLSSETVVQNAVLCGITAHNTGTMKITKVGRLNADATYGRVVLNGVFSSNSSEGIVSDCSSSIARFNLSDVSTAAVYGIGDENYGSVSNFVGEERITSDISSSRSLTISMGINKNSGSMKFVSMGGTLNIASATSDDIHETADVLIGLIALDNSGEIYSVNLSELVASIYSKGTNVANRIRYYGVVNLAESEGSIRNVYLADIDTTIDVESAELTICGIAYYSAGYIKNVRTKNWKMNVTTSADNRSAIKLSGIAQALSGETYDVYTDTEVTLDISSDGATISGGMMENNSDKVQGLAVNTVIDGVIGNVAGLCIRNNGVISESVAMSYFAAQNVQVASLGIIENVGTISNSVIFGRIDGITNKVYAVSDRSAVLSYAILPAAGMPFEDEENVLRKPSDIEDFADRLTAVTERIVKQNNIPISNETKVNLLTDESGIDYRDVIVVEKESGDSFDLNEVVGIHSERGIVSAAVWNNLNFGRKMTVDDKGKLTIDFNGTSVLSAAILVKTKDGIDYYVADITVTATGYNDIRGEGSAEDPFLINDIATLKLIERYPTDCFALSADLNVEKIEPMCTNSAPFSGVLDGRSHTLTIQNIASAANVAALFGSISGEIKNLKIVVRDIEEADVAAVLAVESSGAVISGCSVSIINVELSADETRIAGLIYRTDSETVIRNCNVDINGLTINSVSADIAGLVMENYGMVGGSYVKYRMDIAADSANISCFVRLNAGDVSRCFASGICETSCGTLVEAGFVNTNKASIADCYSAGRLQDEDSSGAISGFVYLNSGAISRCYVTGYADVNGAETTAYSFAGKYDSIHNKQMSDSYNNCIVDSTVFGYSAVYPAQFANAKEYIRIGETSVLTVSSKVWEIENGHTILSGLNGQIEAITDLTQMSAPDTFRIDGDGSLMRFFKNENPYDVVFVNPVWSVVDGQDTVRIIGARIGVLKQGVSTIRYDLGTHHREYNIKTIVFESGSGTLADPFVIGTLRELECISLMPDKCYKLADHLALDVSLLKVSLCEDTPFCGRLDGNNGVLYGLRCCDGQYGGLFARTEGAVISDLNIRIDDASHPRNVFSLTPAQEYDDRYIGYLIGYGANTTVNNVKIDATLEYNTSLMSTDIADRIYFGGIIGYSMDCTISNSSTIVSFDESGSYYSNDKIVISALSGGNCDYDHCTSIINTRFLYLFDRANGTALLPQDLQEVMQASDCVGWSATIQDVAADNFDISSGIVSYSIADEYDIETVNLIYTLSDNTTTVGYLFSIYTEEDEE